MMFDHCYFANLFLGECFEIIISNVKACLKTLRDCHFERQRHLHRMQVQVEIFARHGSGFLLASSLALLGTKLVEMTKLTQRRTKNFSKTLSRVICQWIW